MGSVAGTIYPWNSDRLEISLERYFEVEFFAESCALKPTPDDANTFWVRPCEIVGYDSIMFY